jgi:catechol 2,3-dioxygenase-like lactoylglutathione lyase family enzyme
MSSTLLDAIPILPCSNLETALAFYARLGFSAVMRSEHYAIVRRDGAELHFARVPPRTTPGEAMCCIRVASTDALYREFTDRGLRLDPPLEREWYVKELNVFDPDGNTLKFAEPIEDRVLQFEARR